MNPKYSDLVKEPSASDHGLIGITSIMTRYFIV